MEVHREYVAHAHVVVTFELHANIFVLAGAIGFAPEKGVHLDAKHDGHLAPADGPAGFIRRLHDAVPSLTLPPELIVDELLQVLGCSDLRIHGCHVVAETKFIPLHIKLADHLIIHRQHDHQAQPALVSPLQPAIVHLLVHRRVPLGPGIERAPAVGGMVPSFTHY